MSDLKFKRLVVLSKTERTAKSLEFHPAATIVTGPNHLGKSALIKTLHWTLGAETRFSSEWKAARITSLLQFDLHGREWSIMREGSTFSVFDQNGVILDQYTKITSELAPYLSRLFNFRLQLTLQKGDRSIIAPPAYYFLPYYFDQDGSWTSTWSSFTNLQQVRNWKDDVPEYHVGIKPNAYYEMGSEQASLTRERDKLQHEVDTVRDIRDELADKLQTSSFEIDLVAFENEITEILVECEKIRETANIVRDKLVTLHNERISLNAQIQLVKSSLAEFGKDYKFLKEQKGHLDCPLCLATYPTDFADVFEIALDQDRCEELLTRLREEMERVKASIDSERSNHTQHEEEVHRIEKLLARKKESVSLKDLIENESRKQLATTLKEKVEALTGRLVTVQVQIEDIKRKLKALVSTERKQQIMLAFRAAIRRNFLRLAVPIIPENKIKRVSMAILRGGSYQPRALLAYGFSILSTIYQRFAGEDSSATAPIVIDSPIQQDQDTENHLRILEFIRDERPNGSQLILAVVDDKGVDFGGKVIRLSNERRAVLQADLYGPLSQELEPFFSQSLFFKDKH